MIEDPEFWAAHFPLGELGGSPRGFSPAASNRPITEQNTVKQITPSHEGPNGMINGIKKAMIRHRPWSLETPNVENPTSNCFQGRLGVCCRPRWSYYFGSKHPVVTVWTARDNYPSIGRPQVILAGPRA